MSNKNKTKSNHNKSLVIYEIKLIVLAAITLLLVLSLYTNTVGIIGKVINSLAKGLFSRAGFFLPFVILIVVFVNMNKNFQHVKKRITIATNVLFFAMILLNTNLSFEYLLKSFQMNSIKFFSVSSIVESFKAGILLSGGGVVGNYITYILYHLIGNIGIYILIGVSFITSILLFSNYSLKRSFNALQRNAMRLHIQKKNRDLSEKIHINEKKINSVKKASERMRKKGFRVSRVERPESDPVPAEEEEIEVIEYNDVEENDPVDSSEESSKKVLDFESKAKEKRELKQSNEQMKNQANDNPPTKKLKDSDIDAASEKAVESEIEEKTHIQFPNYKLPSLALLNKGKKTKKKENSKFKKKAKVLMDTLTNFNVDGKIVSITNGPTITRYELKPSPGIKLSKIKGLSDDIALKLAVQRVRIAPVPNKAVIGIEIPNQDSNLVTLREVLSSKSFKDSESKLNFVLGKNISGKTVNADLAKMPHMLIAGATGSGKSVCVNTIINSILYSATPDEVKFLMIDPKVVELSHYNGIPHLVLPVVTDPKKAAIALNWAVKEMEKRYQSFAESFTRDLKSYNRKHPNQKMTQIVVIIDELADLMMVAPKQVENSISRIAQKARAAGIHLVIATQRPSVDVITGVIKANIPTRVSFAVSSAVDSRTILDEGGAEKLLGQGDMLYKPVGAPKPIRLQGAFISNEEVGKTTEFIKNQIDNEKIEYKDEILEKSTEVNFDNSADEYLNEAIKIIVKAQKGSISLLQRKLRIGYNRAARMIDAMELKNIVGPSNGSKPREVLMTEAELEELEL